MNWIPLPIIINLFILWMSGDWLYHKGWQKGWTERDIRAKQELQNTIKFQQRINKVRDSYYWNRKEL